MFQTNVSITLMYNETKLRYLILPKFLVGEGNCVDLTRYLDPMSWQSKPWQWQCRPDFWLLLPFFWGKEKGRIVKNRICFREVATGFNLLLPYFEAMASFRGVVTDFNLLLPDLGRISFRLWQQASKTVEEFQWQDNSSFENVWLLVKNVFLS